MRREILFLIILALAVSAPPGTAPAADPNAAGTGQALDLTQTLSRVVAHNPRLAAFSRQVREADARALQAGLLPNPELRTEIENIAGTGAFSGTDESETTVLLSQSIELGGKRGRRRHAADLDTELATWTYERTRVAALYEAAVTFVDVLANQQRLALADEAIDLANQVRATVRRRVDAGSSSRVELTRAEIATSTARLERERRVRALSATRQRLAATWGATTPGFDRAVGALGRVRPIPPLQELRARLAENPEIARWTTELARREALVELERSRAIPDVTIGAGYRRLSGPDENAFVAELSLPLPLFDRNQGAIQEARERVLRIADERRAIEVGLDRDLVEAYEALVAAHAAARAFDDSLLPGASETFATLRAGYREGRFSYLDVLDAQRVLVVTRARRLDALADYHQTVATIEWLTGSLPTAALENADTEKGRSR